MLIPTHSILVEGKGDKLVVEQNIQDLHYGNWLLGLDSITIVNVGKIDTIVKLSSSLVHKNINCFMGKQDSLEPLTLIQFYNSSTSVKKTIKNNLYFEKLFPINNIGHTITFHLDALTQDKVPADAEIFLLFSLYKSK
jgi:hypothetical protein